MKEEALSLARSALKEAENRVSADFRYLAYPLGILLPTVSEGENASARFTARFVSASVQNPQTRKNLRYCVRRSRVVRSGRRRRRKNGGV